MGVVDLVESNLKTKLEPANLVVTDLSDGCGAKLHILIVSSKFEGVKPTIKRHRMVHEAIEQEMKEQIHAVTLKTLTPEEYAKQQQTSGGDSVNNA